jgi:hypothetical protein
MATPALITMAKRLITAKCSFYTTTMIEEKNKHIVDLTKEKAAWGRAVHPSRVKGFKKKGDSYHV